MNSTVTTFRLFLFSTVFLSLVSCTRYPGKGKSRNEGAIVSDFTVPECYTVKTYTNSECIIRSVADFDTVKNGNCTPGSIDVDLSQYSVIGKSFSYGCNASIIRNVKIDDELKRYLYTIKYKESGLCKRLGHAFNLVVVPKIPAGYEVVFDLHKD